MSSFKDTKMKMNKYNISDFDILETLGTGYLTPNLRLIRKSQINQTEKLNHLFSIKNAKKIRNSASQTS